jgi:sugar phosphate isomerase/epimerase
MTDRREFVQTLGAAAAAYLLHPRAPNPYSRTPLHKIDRIGLQLYTVRDEMKKDVEGTLARVAEAGYGEVEFAGYFGKSPAEIRAMLDHHGLTAPSTHIGLTTPEAWHEALDTAHVIGHQYVVVPWIPEEKRKGIDDYKRIAADFNKAAEQARAAGLQFAYHNHDFEFGRVEGKLPYDVLLAETDPKLVQMEMDLYWITKGGQDPLAYFGRWPGRFPMVHVKDSMGPPDNKMADVGAGKIDWKRIFAREEQAGIKHFFVEHDQPSEPFASIKASCDYLKRLEF